MLTNSSLFSVEPCWKSYSPYIRHHLPKNIASWINEKNSLTQRLRNTHGDAVNVKILFHQWKSPFLSESKHLNLYPHRYCLIREVLLSADEKPLILARTILPKKTITNAQRQLSHLGTRPLGEVIFSDPYLKRLAMDISLLKKKHWNESLPISPAIWGRRTVYAIQNQPLLVSEFFLPDALRC
ncbi:MAG: chorismate lyase [Methylococcales bacterium]|nr:chorismate lyase [Methylococcales bacterium]